VADGGGQPRTMATTAGGQTRQKPERDRPALIPS